MPREWRTIPAHALVFTEFAPTQATLAGFCRGFDSAQWRHGISMPAPAQQAFARLRGTGFHRRQRRFWNLQFRHATSTSTCRGTRCGWSSASSA